MAGCDAFFERWGETDQREQMKKVRMGGLNSTW